MTESWPLMGIQYSWKRRTPTGYVSRADIRPVHAGTASMETLRYFCAPWVKSWYSDTPEFPGLVPQPSSGIPHNLVLIQQLKV